MNKVQYLTELEKELKAQKVENIADVLEEYSEHFNFKVGEGFSEEEISAKLERPKTIAEQFAGVGGRAKESRASKIILGVGISFVDIFMSMVYIMLIGVVVVLGVFSLACLVLGFCLITTLNIAALIPSIPYFCALLLGLSILAFAVLSMVGTFWAFLYVNQWAKKYLRWHSNLFGNRMLPPKSWQPKLALRTKRALQLITMVSLVAFVGLLAIGLIACWISSGSFEPWHVWNWFV